MQQFSLKKYKRAEGLKVQNKNKYQISHETLPKFLERQLENDKKYFVKKKEILFIGRSNVGKSSLINAIFRDQKIARKAKSAGTTKFLHFHQIHNEHAYIIDAPGYGFANMNKRRRHLWFGLTQQYLKVSSRVSQVYLLIHFQHGLKDIDKQFLKRVNRYNVQIQLLFTKVDKVKEQNYFSQFRAINQDVRRLELKNVNNLVMACSSKTNFGLTQLRAKLIHTLENSVPRKTQNNEDLLLSYVKQLRVQPTDIKQPQPQLSKEYIVRKLIYNSKLTKYLV